MTRPSRLVIVSALAVSIGATAAYAGDPANWLGGSGSWSDSGFWDIAQAPNNNGTTYDVSIGGLTDDVSLDLNVTVDTVSNSGTLRLLDGFGLTLAQPGGLTNTGLLSISHAGTSSIAGILNNTGFAWVQSGSLNLTADVNNDGTMWLGDGSFVGTSANLNVNSSLSLNGSGELYFNSFGINPTSRPLINVSQGNTLTNSVDHRIHGGTATILGAGSLVNYGLIDSDVPNRTITIDTNEFANHGNLWARSGDLDVDVANWANTGTVLVSNGSDSLFSGTMFTNTASGLIESAGASNLTLAQAAVDNLGTMSTSGSGQLTFSQSNQLITNFPGSSINATAGTVRFQGTNTFIQNLGSIVADQGSVHLTNGTDMFGGTLTLGNNSTATSSAGITTITQVHTTIDATSRLEVTNFGAGSSTLTYNGILTNNGGTLAARSAAVGTATFNLNGEVFDSGGTILADGGVFNINAATLVESGNLALDVRNGGQIDFTNVDATAATMGVSWTGFGGRLEFDNYRTPDSPTTLSLAGWTATNGTFNVFGGSNIHATNLPILPAGSTINVSGANSALTWSGLSQTPSDSLIDLVSGGKMTAANMTVDGDFQFRGGTFEGNVNLNPSATFTVTLGSNLLDGDLTWVGGRTFNITGSSTRLAISGSANVDAASSFHLLGNSAFLEGSGLITNSGLIQGSAPNNSNTTFLDIDVVNNAGGIIRAAQNGVATGTNFEIDSNVSNAGLLEANGATLRFTGATVTNAGSMQALDHASGSGLVFNGSTTVTDAGGTTSVDGPNSSLNVSGGSNVHLGTFSLTNGADATLTGTNSVMTTTNPLAVGSGTTFVASASARLETPSVGLDGELQIQSSAVINAPISVNPTGHLMANSGTGTINGAISVTNDGGGSNGTISLLANSARIDGTGSITNAGLIQGGAPSSSNSTFIDKDINNLADGVIRAFRNGAPTNTFLQLTGDITNDGLMEADGANLYFNGANVANNSTIRALDTTAASKLIFLNGATVTDSGGITEVGGPASTLEVSGASDVELGTLTLSNGAGGFASGAGSRITADATFGPGSVFSLQGGAVLAGPHLQLDGQMIVQSSSIVETPTTVSPTGQITANSTIATINAPVQVQNDGLGGHGRITILGNSERINGTGLITNSGLIEGGAISSNNTTFLDNDVVNQPDGVIRAFQNGAPVNTHFQLSGNVDNSGLMEGDAAHLDFTGAAIVNSGTIQAINGGGVSFNTGATVTNAGGTLHYTPGTTGVINGVGTVVESTTQIDPGATVTLQSSAQLLGPAVQVDGVLVAQSSSVVGAPITVGSTGQITANSGTVTFNSPVQVENDGLGGTGRIALLTNSATINGPALITNHGVIEGGAVTNSNSTFLNNNVVNESDGVIRAIRNGTPVNTFFQILGQVDNAGLMEAEGANLYFTTGSTVTNSGTLRAAPAAVASKLIFLNGATVTDAGGMTEIDGPLSALEVSAATDVQLGTLDFVNGGGGFVTGAGSRVTADTTIDPASSFLVTSSGLLTGSGIQVDGILNVQSSGVVEAPVTVGSTGQFLANSAVGIINSPVLIQNDGLGGNGRLTVLNNNGRVNGTGLITNSGIIEGGANGNSGSTFLESDVNNLADGIIRAFQNGAPTNTFFQLSGDIDNAGIMEAEAANLYFTTGSNVLNSGTLRTVDAASTSKLIFLNSAQVTDAGGTTEIDGALSSLEVSALADVQLGSLSFTNGGGGFVTGAGTRITADTTIGSGSTFSLTSSGLLTGSGVEIAGNLVVQSNGVVTAPITINPTGQLTANSGTGIINAPVLVQEDGLGGEGRISVLNNSARMNGTGLITNSGIIEGGANGGSGSTFLENNINNLTDGVVRAFQNGAATNTFFQLSGDIDNAGIMEAEAANLYFTTGASVINSGTLRTVDAANTSKLVFLNGATVTDAGGTTQIDGALSSLEVSAAANVALGSLSFSNGGGGFVTGIGTRITADTTIDPGSTFSVTGSGLLTGPGLQVDGGLVMQTSGRVSAPTVVSQIGAITFNSGVGFLDGNVTIAGDGVDAGRLSLVTSNAQSAGLGDIENFGLIEGGSITNGGTTFVDNELLNRPTGVVRAFSNGGATGTFLTLRGNVLNEGLLEADAATLSLSGTIVDNTAGSWSAINGGRLQVTGSFVGGSSGSNTTIDGDTSLLEVIGGSLVGFDTLSLTNGGDVTVSGANSTLAVAAPFHVGPGSAATAASSGRLQAGGITADGTLAGQGGRFVSNLQLNDGAVFDATSGTTTVDGNVNASSGALVSVTNSSTGVAVNGTLNNAAGATVNLNSNTTALSGSGLFTNNGLLEGGAFSNNSTVTLSKALNNIAQVTATSNTGATNTTFQVTSPTLVNSGNMTAQDAHLTINGSNVTHSGTIRAENGQRVQFTGSAMVNVPTIAGGPGLGPRRDGLETGSSPQFGGGSNGSIEVDGSASLLDIQASSQVYVDTLTLTNGGDVNHASGLLHVANPFTVGTDSVLTTSGISVLSGGGVTVDGVMNADRSTINSTVSIGAAGQLNVTSSSGATFNNTVSNAGTMSLAANSVWMLGSGTVNNSGLIEGRAGSTNNTTFLYNNVINNASGTIRAAQNGAATNTHFQMIGSITNSGIMEADGGNLWFTSGANIQNSNIIRAVDHAAGSRLRFEGGTVVQNLGGTISADGALSTVEVNGAANVGFDTLGLSNGAVATVSGSGSQVAGSINIGAGSTFNAQTSALMTISSAGLINDGLLSFASSADLVANGPVLTGAGSTTSFASGTSADFNDSLTVGGELSIANLAVPVDGDLAFESGSTFSATAGSSILLAGDFDNASTANTAFDSSVLDLNLIASLNMGDPQMLEVAGTDAGAALIGLIDNFALDSLILSGVDQFVTLIDAFDNALDGAGNDALYVSTLSISDLDSRLLLNGINVYYESFIGDMSQIDLSLGGTFTMLPGAIPEPATGLLMLLAGAVVALRRRR